MAFKMSSAKIEGLEQERRNYAFGSVIYTSWCHITHDITSHPNAMIYFPVT